ncbi:MAG TPA: P-loop NTPase fold protein [Terracidiphilus sp.]|nr:P-loop NTPase fold protein [Terracidiphilus sp.]HEV2323589.1 P-loop NTPase fold protein [Terracidiphilus sp.]
MHVDSDYEWLLSHADLTECLQPRARLAAEVASFLKDRVRSGKLPYTVGVFGGWGSGKTTFLALLAQQLEKAQNLRVLYFNSWKYAGFMEIVPSLIYKILRYGVGGTDESRNQAAMRVLLCLGKEYSDTFGEWAKQRIGVNPVKLFEQVYGELDHLDKGSVYVSPKMLEAYYTQVDKAQDVLKEVLGSVEDGKEPERTVIVLIDELDRCDPDEAFLVIKQLRVLFSMRKLPIAFVVCANPEPIGLAIKHHYGLESEGSDYEARRILEKFVDSYEDLGESIILGPLVQSMWKKAFRDSEPWILAVDAAQTASAYEEDVVMNATGFDAITTAAPLYSNLRVLLKSFQYVEGRAKVNRHLLWTIWHLEIAAQIDPHFRNELRLLAGALETIACGCYQSLASLSFVVQGNRRLVYETDKGRTLFAIFRSYFWEHARRELDRLDKSSDPEVKRQAQALHTLLLESRRVDFVILLCLLPFRSAPRPAELLSRTKEADLSALQKELEAGLRDQFGYLLASY